MMTVPLILIRILLLVVAGWALLRLAARFACVELDRNTIFTIALLCSLLMIIPYAGFFLSFFFIVSMTYRLSEADLFPDSTIIGAISAPGLYLARLILFM